MSALSIIIDIVLILISIVLIVAVLMQEGQRQGLGAIGGGAETFFGKNKAKSMEGRLQKITKIAAAAFIVLAIVATIITSRGLNKTSTAAVTDVVADEVEAVEDEVEAIEDEAEAVVDETEAAVEEAAGEAEAAIEEAADETEAAVEETVETVEEAAGEVADEAAGN